MSKRDMKGRSHRPQSVDPHEDWVDGSWTVDCVCGVNFDDGEEMVNCDECGVWVHTRCSKYVKGEELFACDKCKKKNNRCSSHNDSEETEVAQLLVELPTKTVRMETSYNGSARRSVKLWTDMPMESRVHVQGIPGGDPELFNGLSSVFSPQLWKCTGYVPKKFNFQYEEFPCRGKRRGGNREAEENDLENENPVDEGAGVLFSLSKESAVVTPVTNLVGMRGGEGQDGFERKVCAKEMKLGTEGINFSRSQDGLKKERSLLRPVVLHSGKRKKEDLYTSNDRSAKKGARTSDKEADERKRGVYPSRTVFSPSSDANQLQFYEDRDPDSSTADIQSIKIHNLGEHVNQEHVSKGHLLDVDVNQHKNNPATVCGLDASSCGISRHKFSNGMGLEEVTARNEVLAENKSSPITDVTVSMSEPNDSRSIHVRQEGDSAVDDKLVYKAEPSAKSNVKHQDMPCVATVVLESQNFKDLGGDMSQWSVPRNIEVKKEVDDSMKNSDTDDVRIQSKSNDRLSAVSKTNDVVSSSLQYTDQKAHDVERTPEVVDDCLSDKARKVNDGPQFKRELDGSDRHAKVQKSISDSKNGPGLTKDQAKSGETGLNSQAVSSQHKVVQCVGKSLLASDNIASKSSASDDWKPEDAQNSSLNRLRGISDSSISSWKDNAGSEVARVREKNDQLRKTVKEHSKSSLNYVSKVSLSGRISQATVSKRTISDLKDSVPFLSTKLSSVQNADVTSASGDTDKLMQSQCPLNLQNKVSSSGSTIKGERSNQSNFQPSSKGNHGSVASNSTATLSDEELALLLHQELNSSPRVPRVPRVRHAGSLPQLASPTATNMLIKRTSSSGVKDHGLVPRRKHKDLFRDGSRSSREHDDEGRKMDIVTSSSSDFRKQDMGYTVDAYANRDDNGIPTAVNSVKKNMPSVSTSTANSGPSSSTEANDQNVSSARRSPRNISDDDTGMGGPVHRTLPGLINEIMSKGKRMTYEELCNAVLPHWPHLRKHNGERYAYSSHSQAVLDCLRNRHEWARLVDRGPKTNSSRKKRKPDAEDDSEDDGYGNGRTAKEVQCKSLESQKEEFPKGKRKARKRRRLALQGRGIKDLRKRRKSDDDVDLISNSSEESMFSEDEPHVGACRAASEASDSSDETRTS